MTTIPDDSEVSEPQDCGGVGGEVEEYIKIMNGGSVNGESQPTS